MQQCMRRIVCEDLCAQVTCVQLKICAHSTFHTCLRHIKHIPDCHLIETNYRLTQYKHETNTGSS